MIIRLLCSQPALKNCKAVESRYPDKREPDVGFRSGLGRVWWGFRSGLVGFGRVLSGSVGFARIWSGLGRVIAQFDVRFCEKVSGYVGLSLVRIPESRVGFKVYT